MGNNNSATNKKHEGSEIDQLESLFSGSAPPELPALQRVFEKLRGEKSDSIQTSGLEKLAWGTLSPGVRKGPANVSVQDIFLPSDAYLPLLPDPQSLAKRIINSVFRKEGDLLWQDFVQGVARCCREQSASARLSLLLSLFILNASPSGDESAPPSTLLERKQVEHFFASCWIMSGHSEVQRNNKDNVLSSSDFEFLVQGALQAGSGQGQGEHIAADKLGSWITASLPSLPECLPTYVAHRLSAEDSKASSSANSNAASEEVTQLQLSPLTAWAIGLSQRGGVVGPRLLTWATHPASSSQPDFLYGARVHGRGVSRLLGRVEGYSGPVVVLIAATTAEGQRWEAAVILNQGLENKSSFYGASGSCMLALHPCFRVLRSLGRDSNYVYTHTKVAGQAYQATPMPQGMGFGGTRGKERVWVDVEFESVLLHHHALDKTYGAGELVPNQGYGEVRSRVEDVEVWGMGGTNAKEHLATYQKREALFSEQRAKVDLSKFGNWEDSPEKMMLNMVSNPNKPEREER